MVSTLAVCNEFAGYNLTHIVKKGSRHKWNRTGLMICCTVSSYISYSSAINLSSYVSDSP